MWKKKLVVFCDGTWKKADQKAKDGRPCPTNVLRLLEATGTEDERHNSQLVDYIAGVGIRWDERISGGGFGFGISANIKDAYRFLVSNYKPDDEIFLFGFSRGAFTARSIAGLINNLGILKRENLHLVNEAYKRYRDRSDEWHPSHGKEAKKFRDSYSHPNPAIAFLGVWDTVGALGAPFGLIISWITDQLFKTSFHDVTLSPIVLSAYHALAIDERRWPFRPTLWKLHDAHLKIIAKAKEKGAPSPFEQQWFPGVHSNVGGGYEKTGLSDCALEWMIEKARQHGLNVVVDPKRPLHPSPNEKPENSQSIFVRLPTIAFVRLPRPLLKRFLKGDDGELVDYVQLNGDFERPIGSHNNKFGYAGELSQYARTKLAEDESYKPRNIHVK